MIIIQEKQKFLNASTAKKIPSWFDSKRFNNDLKTTILKYLEEINKINDSSFVSRHISKDDSCLKENN